MPVSRPKVKSIASTKSATGLAWLATSEPRNIGELANRMRQDYQIRLAESILAANIQAAKVTVHVAGNARAQILGRHLERLWKDTLPAMLRCIGDGRVAFEKVWEYSAEANLNYIRKLDPLPFAQTSMQLTDEGEFDGIDLDVGEREPLEIPPGNCWWLALDPTPMEPHGRSRFLGAPFAVWKERREAIRLRSVLRTRMIVSGGVAHIPMTETLENGQQIDNAVEMARAHDSRLAGSLMLLSNERNRDGHYIFDYTEPPSTLDLAPLDASIDGLDQEQLQAFGIPPKTVLEGDSTGSYAMVSQQMLTLYAVVEDILTQLENSFQKYVIEKELELNFEPLDMPIIEIRHAPLADRPDTFQTDVLKSALTGQAPSALLTCGAIDLKKMLEAAGIPLTEDAGGKLRDLLSQRGSPTGKDAGEGSCGCGGKGVVSKSPANQQPDASPASEMPRDAGGHEAANDFLLEENPCGNGGGSQGFQHGNTCWKLRHQSGRDRDQAPASKDGKSDREEAEQTRSGPNVTEGMSQDDYISEVIVPALAHVEHLKRELAAVEADEDKHPPEDLPRTKAQLQAQEVKAAALEAKFISTLGTDAEKRLARVKARLMLLDPAVDAWLKWNGINLVIGPPKAWYQSHWGVKQDANGKEHVDLKIPDDFSDWEAFRHVTNMVRHHPDFRKWASANGFTPPPKAEVSPSPADPVRYQRYINNTTEQNRQAYYKYMKTAGATESEITSAKRTNFGNDWFGPEGSAWEIVHAASPTATFASAAFRARTLMPSRIRSRGVGQSSASRPNVVATATDNQSPTPKILKDRPSQSTNGPSIWTKTDKSVGTNSNNDAAKIAPTAQSVNVAIGKLPAGVRDYIKDIETRTGRKLHTKQIENLADALRKREYTKTPKSQSDANRDKFDDVKDKLIAEWEQNTGQSWPRYLEDVPKKNGKKGFSRYKGAPYDAHHIIENEFDGPITWWNIHPAKFPDEHQGGIHGKGSPLRQIIKAMKP